jgi:hypothetical protein
VDLAATIVDAAGAEPGRTLDGVSLLELAQRPSAFSSIQTVPSILPRARNSKTGCSRTSLPKWKV